jgi:hypothetical protein
LPIECKRSVSTLSESIWERLIMYKRREVNSKDRVRFRFDLDEMLKIHKSIPSQALIKEGAAGLFGTIL